MTLGTVAVARPGAAGYTPRHGRLDAAPRRTMMRAQEELATMPDEALAGRLRDQDVRVLEVLYDRHSRAVFSLAFKMLADHEGAEEIVQETFLKLWQRPDTYVPDRGKLLSWLLGVAHHRAIDRLRRRRLELRYANEQRFVEPSGSVPDPENELLATLRGEAVIRALQTLPDAQRLAVELAYVRGMTQVEIAEALGEPLGTIKTRLRLAMQKLRTSLELAEMRPGPA